MFAENGMSSCSRIFFAPDRGRYLNFSFLLVSRYGDQYDK